MKTITAKTPHDSSFSFSRRYFTWKKKLVEDDSDNDEEILTFNNSSSHFEDESVEKNAIVPSKPTQKTKNSPTVLSRLKSALAVFSPGKSSCNSGKLLGTLFGYRRGHVCLAFQEDARKYPAFLIELAMPTSVLVREMASGLVRVALECEKKGEKRKIVEELLWRTYCNGKKCGYAMKRECGEDEWKVLKAVEMISMGAGVLPGRVGDDGSGLGELMYMRARFERVVGSRDSEAYYMMNPDGSNGPELSVYLLRV